MCPTYGPQAVDKRSTLLPTAQLYCMTVVCLQKQNVSFNFVHIQPRKTNTAVCTHTHTYTHTQKTAWNGKNSFLPFLVVEGCEAAVTLSVQGCVNPTVCLLKGGAVVVVLPRCLRAGQVCCSLQVLFLWQGLCFSISAELYFGLDIFMEDPTCKPATPSGGLTFLVLTSKFISCLFGCSHCRLKWHRVFGFFCPYVTHISLTQPTFIHGP